MEFDTTKAQSPVYVTQSPDQMDSGARPPVVQHDELERQLQQLPRLAPGTLKEVELPERDRKDKRREDSDALLPGRNDRSPSDSGSDKGKTSGLGSFDGKRTHVFKSAKYTRGEYPTSRDKARSETQAESDQSAEYDIRGSDHGDYQDQRPEVDSNEGKEKHRQTNELSFKIGKDTYWSRGASESVNKGPPRRSGQGKRDSRRRYGRSQRDRVADPKQLKADTEWDRIHDRLDDIGEGRPQDGDDDAGGDEGARDNTAARHRESDDGVLSHRTREEDRRSNTTGHAHGSRRARQRASTKYHDDDDPRHGADQPEQDDDDRESRLRMSFQTAKSRSERGSASFEDSKQDQPPRIMSFQTAKSRSEHSESTPNARERDSDGSGLSNGTESRRVDPRRDAPRRSGGKGDEKEGSKRLSKRRARSEHAEPDKREFDAKEVMVRSQSAGIRLTARVCTVRWNKANGASLYVFCHNAMTGANIARCTASASWSVGTRIQRDDRHGSVAQASNMTETNTIVRNV
eukprot:3902269-Rhodomonas_salina.2